jgi:DNA-binding winged helix-turn-helix (wHTH) protein
VEPTPPEIAFSCVTFAQYRLLPSLRSLERSGQPVELGSRAFDLLCRLIERAGDIVTTRDLMSHVWGKTLVGEGSLRFHINALRKALAQDGLGTPYIKNVARRGYAFVAPVRRHAIDQAPDTATAELAERPPQHPRIIGRVTIVGSGGVGKSTAAVEVAYLLRETFDLIRFVDLEPINDAS